MSFFLKSGILLIAGIVLTFSSFSQKEAPGYQGNRLKLTLIGGISPGMLQSPYGKRDEYKEPYEFGSSLKNDGIIKGVFTVNPQLGLSADWALNRLHGIGIKYTFQKAAVPNGASKVNSSDFGGGGTSHYNSMQDYIKSYDNEIYQDVNSNLICVYFTLYRQLAPTGMNTSFGIGKMFYSVQNAPSGKPAKGNFTYVMWRYSNDVLITKNLFFSAGLEIGYLLGGPQNVQPQTLQFSHDLQYYEDEKFDIPDETLEGLIKQGLMNQSLFQLKFGLSYVL